MTSRPPSWCSKTMTTSFPEFSLLLRERNMVAAGHVEMCVNILRRRGKSSTKLCRLNDGILSGVGENSCFKIAIEFPSSLQTALLSACYDKLILKAKQVICLGNLYLKKDLLFVLPTGYWYLSWFASAKSAVRKFAYILRTCSSWKEKDNTKVTQTAV